MWDGLWPPYSLYAFHVFVSESVQLPCFCFREFPGFAAIHQNSSYNRSEQLSFVLLLISLLSQFFATCRKFVWLYLISAVYLQSPRLLCSTARLGTKTLHVIYLLIIYFYSLIVPGAYPHNFWLLCVDPNTYSGSLVDKPTGRIFYGNISRWR